MLIGCFPFFSFANNQGLCGPVTGHPCPGSPPFSPPPPFVPPPPISAPGDLVVAHYDFGATMIPVLYVLSIPTFGGRDCYYFFKSDYAWLFTCAFH